MGPSILPNAVDYSHKKDQGHVKPELYCNVVIPFLCPLNTSNTLGCTLMLDKSTYSLKVDSLPGIYASICLCLLLKVAFSTPVILYCAYSTNIQFIKLKKKLVLGVLIIYNYSKFVQLVREGASNE